MLVLKGTIRAIQTWMARNATRDNLVVQSHTVEVGHVWVHFPTASRVCVDVGGSCYHRRLCGYLGSWLPPRDTLAFGAMLPLGPCHSGQFSMPARTTMTSRSGLLPKSMSVSMELLQPESVLLSVVQYATKDHTDSQDLDLHL